MQSYSSSYKVFVIFYVVMRLDGRIKIHSEIYLSTLHHSLILAGHF